MQKDHKVANIQIIIEAFCLWNIYAHHVYKDILRPAGLKYILIYAERA